MVEVGTHVIEQEIILEKLSKKNIGNMLLDVKST